ncbi:Dabb family protein [Tautonia plasticadhaerens]|uniref:Stress responsive A/B Barrel Domain protein n=1 Tax=Tautonia plasticadhaerens TaxID=2527974 RepID=A0A518H6C3_9BACT|nr:Dabb family protein [Tautonia plasticadhaerens]QDV36378.1 Stress responsive A/B Barrel Domain protein [Tautonia plasticadhaerens]
MKSVLIRWSVPALVTIFVLGANAMPPQDDAKELAHMVFFTLKVRSEESRQRFVDSCHTYLADIEGTTYFSVGTIAEDVEEPVSVKDWDVALHVVFRDKATKEAYLVHPQHERFVEENRPHFAKVRVFDSYLIDPSE